MKLRWVGLPILGMRRIWMTKGCQAILVPCIATLLLLAASGCAVHRVRSDFAGFEKAYADTSNRELLLNLARLQNHDPTYFFKMGQITSAYRMVASVSTNVGYLSQSTVPGKSNTSGSGSPGLSYESDPLFQFIPVNDETNAQLLLKPIPADTFYILYQQGWRMDQLLRLMIDRIEVTHSGTTGCEITTYRNVPPALKFSGGKAVPLDPQQLSNYATFLRITAVAYGLQKHGSLMLRGVSTFVPLDSNAVSAGSSQGPGGAGPSNAQKENGISATDIEKAAEKNLTYESVNGKILIGERVVNPKFYLIPPKAAPTGYEPDIDKIEGMLGNDQHFRGLKDAQVLKGFLTAMRNGFTIEDDSTSAEQGSNPCPTGNDQSSVHLVLRSLIGVMAAAAQEQAPFDALNDSNTPVQALDGTGRSHPFDEEIPDIERLPILRIDWKPDTLVTPAQPLPPLQPTPQLVAVNYRGTNYFIADPEDPLVRENEYWNRDVFRLIGALTAQVTVDISKYPVPDILQLHTN